jgi:hypothetical protein
MSRRAGERYLSRSFMAPPSLAGWRSVRVLSFVPALRSSLPETGPLCFSSFIIIFKKCAPDPRLRPPDHPPLKKQPALALGASCFSGLSHFVRDIRGGRKSGLIGFASLRSAHPINRLLVRLRLVPRLAALRGAVARPASLAAPSPTRPSLVLRRNAPSLSFGDSYFF